ncbi:MULTISPECIES: 50S ribosomal protein L21 [Dictyoglomus]|jgi:large subunit ribosomal protein L21|uniref:Large ribosomal subunit protein bL21 n=1 Tax=Dictyoglomus turgidum (strain DSM 6724 / Z-1310) TaxID=515635 RepID=RL21_DICTD|nr:MULTISPECIES: 50S ribosomal protein L21 [Dictyoglomus]B8E0B4.1 RecName: Full=Large ribosomal subunit protein bL21; AltName: Full=50S ribosomal protein L21 [Dictyoglomus turgidum DSM 6724]ACK42559.1 ribosomal protein L21 [Dictyoglomus turgidum DSM 6724]PNV79638.1 MAG: 50S ribosomal protein L21 [Dictyoglomus turgidum]HBU32237.1 50S ribosomal protein L21 [Dictyoglomus sp.]
MFVVVETGGKQYKVSVGSMVNVEKLKANVGDEVVLDKVLLVGKEDEVIIGQPYVEGAKVIAKVVRQDKYPKVIVFKFKRKKHYRRKYGHRQPYTQLSIKEIVLPH